MVNYDSGSSISFCHGERSQPEAGAAWPSHGFNREIATPFGLAMTHTMKHIFSLTVFLIISSGLGCALNKVNKEPTIRVSISNTRVHEIPLETYVMGVLSKEVPNDWPLETLKAQAVASRTYVLYRKEHPRDNRFDVAADTSDQVFEKKRHYSPSIEQAVHETEGEILEYEGKIFESFFHSCCGGVSETADHVWKTNDVSPLESLHKDPYCSNAPSAHWDYSISRENLGKILHEKNNLEKSSNWSLEVSQRDDQGRVQEISIIPGNNLVLTGKDFRDLLGPANIKSTLFEITSTEDPFVFSGKGSGHGVGLCQWGAKGMGDEGKSYREILEFYYPESQIRSQRKPQKEVEVMESIPPPSELEQDESNKEPIKKGKRRHQNGVEWLIESLPKNP